MEPLASTLDLSTAPLLVAYRQCMADHRLDSMRQKIDAVINPDTHFSKKSLDMRTQKCFAVKTGLNGKLKR